MYAPNLTPSFLLKDKLCPVAVDSLLSFGVQREMLLGKCCFGCQWPVSAMIDLSRLEGPQHREGSL